MGWKYNIQYNTSCYGNVFLHNTNKCVFEKNPIVFWGSDLIIYDQSENVFGYWVELIVTRPNDNGFLLLVKCKYSIEHFLKN